MKLQDCKTLYDIKVLIVKAADEYELSNTMPFVEFEAVMFGCINRAAEIGGEKVREAAASAIEDSVRHGGLYANTLIRTLDVKQILSDKEQRERIRAVCREHLMGLLPTQDKGNE